MVGHGLRSWAFADSPELSVNTTRKVVDDGAPIAMISHDPDGDWQFLDAVEEGNEDAAVERSNDDLLIVDLHHIIEYFPDVAQFADLPIG